jgi:hypothetical protein
MHMFWKGSNSICCPWCSRPCCLACPTHHCVRPIALVYAHNVGPICAATPANAKPNAPMSGGQYLTNYGVNSATEPISFDPRRTSFLSESRARDASTKEKEIEDEGPQPHGRRLETWCTSTQCLPTLQQLQVATHRVWKLWLVQGSRRCRRWLITLRARTCCPLQLMH